LLNVVARLDSARLSDTGPATDKPAKSNDKEETVETRMVFEMEKAIHSSGRKHQQTGPSANFI